MIEPLHRERCWLYLDKLEPGKSIEAMLSFTAKHPLTPRPTPRYTVASDFMVDLRVLNLPLKLYFTADRAPIGELHWQGEQYGRYTVLLWQVNNENRWLAPNAHQIDLITIDDIGYGRGWLLHTPEADAPDVLFAIEWEFMLINGLLMVRCLRLKNRGTRPMRVKGIYHYPLSTLGGDSTDDEPGGVPNYYLGGGVWEDPKANRFYGAMPLDPHPWQCYFFKDESGSQHPDLWIPLELSVQPGGTHALPGGWVALLWGKGRFGGSEWRALTQRVKAYGDLIISGATL